MKKVNLFTLLLFLGFTKVFACGEISDLNSNVGTVKQVNQTNYVIHIASDVKTVNLSANTDYDWVNGYGPREVSTNEKVLLKVDGNKCGYGIYTYFIEFKKDLDLIADNTIVDENKTDEKNTKLKLKSLDIEGYKIEFKSDTREYSINVEKDVNELNIVALPEDENATVTISENSKKIENGINEILINIIDENGKTGEYKLNVNKKEYISNNNYLASIKVGGYNLNFSPSIKEYTLIIKDEKQLNIEVTPENELATYEIVGNQNLDKGSKIIIRVKAENLSTRDYIISIDKKFDIMDYWIYILISFLILVLIILLIINKKKKKKNKPNSISTTDKTVGTIPQNIENKPQNVEQVSNINRESMEKANLEYIQPTNIENNTNNISNETETEVFKL